ncbi:unnamed protein product [Prunus armeniaca]|uniref:Uncharacterized protein n=1 Tax=Prunus armeniaca TaxID=36596 RepID=A0A6J5Y3R7_PRUAR|nr:unnamed protein product [Prunus armeniaca]
MGDSAEQILQDLNERKMMWRSTPPPHNHFRPALKVPHPRVDVLNHNNLIPMHLGGHMLPPHVSLRPMAMVSLIRL